MDIKTLFEENNIRYWSSGEKNVSKGYIGVTCPFPDCDDTSNHMGIRLKDLKCSCWKCGPHNTVKTFQLVLNVSYIDARAIVNNLKSNFVELDVSVEKQTAGKLIFPFGFSNDFPKVFRDYLEKRRFNPRKVIEKYKLMTCYRFGKYAYRIIIPVIKNGKIVSWTSRDITETASSKYKAAKVEESLVRPEELLYNFDSVKEGGDAFLVEGPFDVWRLGDGAFCMFGLKLTGDRLRQIINKRIRKLYIFFDNDLPGKTAARHLSMALTNHVGEVNLLKFRRGNRYNKIDPDMLTDKLAHDLKMFLEFNGD